MTFACPEWTVAEIIDGALCYGYDGVEVRVDSNHCHGLEADTPPEVRQRAAQRFADAGLEIPCVATSLKFARNGAAGQAECAAALPLLDLAADLGARGLRVFGGEPVRDPATAEGSADDPAIAREDAIAWAAHNLSAIAVEAQARGVALWLETHDYFRLGRDVAAVIQQVNHPAVRCNWDVMHPQLNGEDFSQTKQFLKGIIAHTHFHDARSADANSICPFGEGILPLPEMLTWLQEEGFKGYLSAEYFGNSLGADPDESLPLWADGCRRLLAAVTA